ncbi:hypothetical protein FNH08_50410, partial [Streptomyces spongiae]|nr:hypothetical protein [Streptomyces spongiae]
ALAPAGEDAALPRTIQRRPAPIQPLRRLRSGGPGAGPRKRRGRRGSAPGDGTGRGGGGEEPPVGPDVAASTMAPFDQPPATAQELRACPETRRYPSS